MMKLLLFESNGLTGQMGIEIVYTGRHSEGKLTTL
jgi:hypothetical protein